MLVSALVPGSRPYRAGLRVAQRELVLLNAQGTLIEGLALGGHTLREALAWLEEVSARHTGVNAAPLALPQHEMPAHPLAEGGRFGGAEPAHPAELARWFENLERVLRTLTAGRAASPTRVWSHHFDLDTVLDLDTGFDLDTGLALGGERTLGLGFSPGDDSYAEPYLYALPTPYPDAHTLKPLPAPMEWVTDGWVGAVLRGSGVVQRTGDEQAQLIESFYRLAEGALAT